jgi:predicted lipoprotein with Yx(FWY)xxD motif
LGAAVLAGALAIGILGMPADAATKSQPTVSIAKVQGHGKALVDSKNHALYTLVNNHQSVACTGACLDMGFVALTIAPGSKPTAGKGVTGLGVADGNQVTVNGFPLFTFSSDKPHQATGVGMTSSGGTWHIPAVTASSGGKKKGSNSNAGTGGVSF